MLRSRIIPSLLLFHGGLVKTERFKNAKYVGDPINAVKVFNEKQVDELCIFDIGASSENKPPDINLLQAIAKQARMPLCYGGGIRSAEQALQIVSLGFEKVSVSSAALDRPQLIQEIAELIGSQSVTVTLDIKKSRLFDHYVVYTMNGKSSHGVDLTSICKSFCELGAGEIILNSIDRDGTMAGYDISLARTVKNEISVPLTVLGGAGDVSHMQSLLDAIGTAGVAAGSMFVFQGRYRAVLISYVRPDNL